MRHVQPATAAPSGAFEAADGPLNIAANKQEQFEILCRLVGRELTGGELGPLDQHVDGETDPVEVQVMIGGERLSVLHVRRFVRRYPAVVLLNGYGPVESTVFATTHRVTEPDCERPGGIPLGLRARALQPTNRGEAVPRLLRFRGTSAPRAIQPEAA